MQAEVHPLLAINMNPGFTLKFLVFRLLRLSVWALKRDFRFALDQVIARPRRNALGKFTTMVRDQLPAWMFFCQRMNGDLGAIKRTVVRTESIAENKGVWFFRFLFFSAAGHQRLRKSREHKNSNARSRAPVQALFSNHCPRLLRLHLRLRRLHPVHPRDLIPADAW